MREDLRRTEGITFKLTMKRPRLRAVMPVVGGVFVILALVLLRLLHAAAPLPSAIAWKVQPDQYPVGTVLQNSRVEMSLGIFSGLKPAPMPGFVTSLPRSLKSAAEWSVGQFRDAAARMYMHVRVEPPDFVELERSQVEEHVTQGPFAVLSFRLKTRSAGDLHGNLVVHLTGGAFGQTNVIVPLSVRVISSNAPNPRAVLMVETPYECYSTGDGHDFEPLAALNSRLAGRNVRVDFCRQLPRSPLTYDTILLGGAELAGLDQVKERQMRKFVADGGRLILAANHFFGNTVGNANRQLGSYGMRIINTEAWKITNSPIAPDPLTSGVTNVDFLRPSPITVTDSAQGKVLVATQDGLSGYVAVSRQPGRGDVIVLTQSLWWSWIRADPAKTDNLRLLENLLAP
jgi:hypothetical protein